MDKFINYLINISPLSDKTLEEFVKLFTVKKYFAKDKLVRAGKLTDKGFFLDSGIVRSIYLFPEGKEYTRRIYAKPTFFSSYSALILGKESEFTYECITDCSIIEYKYEELNSLANRNIEVGILIRKFLEMLYVSYAERNYNFLTQNATERYLKLREEIPNIDNLVSQKQIASNVGITPIQLSRIRKQILSKPE